MARPGKTAPVQDEPDQVPGTARWERWVQAPRQQRARATFERVLDAGAELLAERGFEGFSMSEVCRRAGVAPGTLYGRVESKEHLFLALHDRELARISAGPVAAMADSPAWRARSTSELLDEVIHVLGSHFAEHAALLRVFILRAAVDPRVRDEGSAMVDQLDHAVVSLLLTRRADYPQPDVEAAVWAAYRLVVDSLSWRMAFGFDFHPHAEGDAEWVGRLQTVVRGYLLVVPS